MRYSRNIGTGFCTAVAAVMPALAVLLAPTAWAAPDDRADPPGGPVTSRPVAPASAPAASAVETIQSEAQAMMPLVRSDLARHFLEATRNLPRIKPRVVLYDREKREAYLPEEAARLSPDSRAGLREIAFDESFYYTTRYGTPLAYARPLDILAAAGFKEVRGRRILDFGYGTIGHLKLLAELGAEVVGVDVDPILKAGYREADDQGPVGSKGGSVRLVCGRFPAEEAVKVPVGRGYDLVISKNTLKNGYIHPARPVDKRMTIDLGVDDDAFVRGVFESLKPGGRFLIYNLCPAPSPPDKPYIPWSDGHCPFPASVLEKAGFRVLVFDKDDTEQARAMAKVLGWDKGAGGMDLEHDLFGLYTLVQKPE